MSAHDTLVLTEIAAQVLCRDSRLSLCLHVPCCAERDVASHVVRLRECTCVHCSRYGAMRCTSAVSSHVLFVYGALRGVTVAEETHLHP